MEMTWWFLLCGDHMREMKKSRMTEVLIGTAQCGVFLFLGPQTQFSVLSRELRRIFCP